MRTYVCPQFPCVLAEYTGTLWQGSRSRQFVEGHPEHHRHPVPSTGAGTAWRGGPRRLPGGNIRKCSLRRSLRRRDSCCPSSRARITSMTFGWRAGTAAWTWTSGKLGTSWRWRTCAKRAHGSGMLGAVSGRCFSGINVGMSVDAEYAPLVHRRGWRNIVVRRHGEAKHLGESHSLQRRHPRRRIRKLSR